MYEYNIGGLSAPWSTYTFVTTFDFTVNGPSNPFSVSGQTSAPYVAQPPGYVTAMYCYGNFVYAFE